MVIIINSSSFQIVCLSEVNINSGESDLFKIANYKSKIKLRVNKSGIGLLIFYHNDLIFKGTNKTFPSFECIYGTMKSSINNSVFKLIFIYRPPNLYCSDFVELFACERKDFCVMVTRDMNINTLDITNPIVKEYEIATYGRGFASAVESANL